MNHYKNHIFFLVYQYLNIVPFQSLNYVHVYDIYKSKVYTYNSQVGLNKTATYEYHICICKNYIQVNLQRPYSIIFKISTCIVATKKAILFSLTNFQYTFPVTVKSPCQRSGAQLCIGYSVDTICYRGIYLVVLILQSECPSFMVETRLWGELDIFRGMGWGGGYGEIIKPFTSILPYDN